MYDLILLVGEPSGDLLGAHLLKELIQRNPSLRIAAVAGPKMRPLLPQTALLFPMEELQVMGFFDVFCALPRLIRRFRQLKKELLGINPKAIVLIDYPGFHLRLESALRKAGYRGRLIHYVCPTIWAYGKGRIAQMCASLDLLLTLFPFEKKYFTSTSLRVEYIGHPLTQSAAPSDTPSHQPLLSLFPGSRPATIRRNLPLQLRVAKKMLAIDPSLSLAISVAQKEQEPLIRTLSKMLPVRLVPSETSQTLMQTSRLALATSGTITLELALHRVPTIVNFTLHPLDLFIARTLLRINLPHYCIVNLLASKRVFPELFGPQLTEEQLFFWTRKLWFDPQARGECLQGCEEVIQLLGPKQASREAANQILPLIFSSHSL